jgi:hypothetical protein
LVRRVHWFENWESLGPRGSDRRGRLIKTLFPLLVSQSTQHSHIWWKNGEPS